jgi:hypothetical protein
MPKFFNKWSREICAIRFLWMLNNCRAAVIAGHLVKADPENPSAWINLANLVRRAENIEQAEKCLIKARDWHPRNA